MSVRARVRGGLSWLRFDGPHQAGRRSAILALLLLPLVAGVTRSYQAPTAAEIVPAEAYALQPLVVDVMLAAADGAGRAWLAVAGWMPEPVAMALLAGLFAVYYALAVDWVWPHVKAAHVDTTTEETPQ